MRPSPALPRTLSRKRARVIIMLLFDIFPLRAGDGY